MDKIEKLTKLLKYLYNGHTVEVEGRCYGMTEDFTFYMLCWDEDNQAFDPSRPLGMNLPISYWADIADKLTDDELFIMSANVVLSKHNRKNRTT